LFSSPCNLILRGNPQLKGATLDYPEAHARQFRHRAYNMRCMMMNRQCKICKHMSKTCKSLQTCRNRLSKMPLGGGPLPDPCPGPPGSLGVCGVSA